PNVMLNQNNIVGVRGLRKPIEDKEYLLLGPCQPKGHIFLKKQIGDRQRSFQKSCNREGKTLKMFVPHVMCYQISSIARVMVIYIDLLSHVDLDFLELNMLQIQDMTERILDENPYAFYIHYFAHQLQLRMYLEEDEEKIQVSYHMVKIDRHNVFPLNLYNNMKSRLDVRIRPVSNVKQRYISPNESEFFLREFRSEMNKSGLLLEQSYWREPLNEEFALLYFYIAIDKE
ncbi:hypothetical protein ACJX0J_017753, partial [Zea mays]